MADGVGFELNPEIFFVPTSVPNGTFVSSPGFELQSPELLFGSLSLPSSAAHPSIPGFVLTFDKIDLVLGDFSVAGRNVPRTPGFEFNLGILDYKKAGDTVFEIYPILPERTYDHEEVEVNTGDIRLEFIDGVATMTTNGGDILRDAGFETALLLSLLSDQRSTIEEVRAVGLEESDLRGWWGNLFEEKPIGSRVWLLCRAKMTAKTISDFRLYALEAWQWLIDDGVVKAFVVTTARYNLETILLTATIQRPDGTEETFKYYLNWQSQLLRRA